MSVKGILNISAALQTIITVGLGIIGFFIVNFYQDAQAQWRAGNAMRTELEVVKFELKARYDATSKDIAEIRKQLDHIIEIKVKRDPPK